MEFEVKQRLEIAERHLANIQSFYPRVDARVGAIFAISSAQLAVAAVNISLPDFHSAVVVTAAIGLLLASAVVQSGLYLCTFPKLVGGSKTTSFFGHIAKLGEADFTSQYESMSVEDFHDDLTRQIWRSSQILAEKYYWLKVSSIALAAATASWLTLLVSVSLIAGKVPVLK